MQDLKNHPQITQITQITRIEKALAGTSVSEPGAVAMGSTVKLGLDPVATARGSDRLHS